MGKQEVQQRIRDVGIVPVIRASSPRKTLMAAEAACAGGISIAEITMTVPGAFQVIEELAKRPGRELIIGAGTVLDTGIARRCLDAGAEFLVSPGLNADIVRLANDAGVLAMAGALTPTEVIHAWTVREPISLGCSRAVPWAVQGISKRGVVRSHKSPWCPRKG